jgi:hypothetical protein
MRGGGGLKVEASLVGFLARFKFEKSGKEKKEFQILSVSSRCVNSLPTNFYFFCKKIVVCLPLPTNEKSYWVPRLN